MKKELFKNKYQIKSARLKNWDYSGNGHYHITICTKGFIPYFGNVADNQMILNATGFMAYQYWWEIPNHFENVYIDEFVIMPDHLHGIIVINDNKDDYNPGNNAIDNGDAMDLEGAMNQGDAMNRVCTGMDDEMGGFAGKDNPMLHKSVSRIIRWYKGRCSFEINKISKDINFKWHPRFYDHVIRTQDALCEVRKYIRNNPVNWQRKR